MPTFPASIPAPLIDGYAVRPIKGRVLRSSLDGLAQTRQRMQTGHEVDLSWCCEPSDFALLSGWLDTYGHDWFTINLNIGEGAATQSARLIGTWAASAKANTWRVTARVEVRL
jgi:hypothetical protein